MNARSARKAWRRRVRSKLFRLVSAIVVPVIGRLPWSWCQRLGRTLGTLAWHLPSRDRQRVLAHLAIAFPQRSAPDRARLARASYRHLGTNLFECLHLSRAPRDAAHRHITVEGRDHLQTLCEAKRPFVLLTGHCGNWELLATLARSHQVPIYAMQRQLDDPALNDTIVSLRAHLGATNLPRGSRASSRGVLKVLREGGALVILLDQDIATEGVWVPFFGRPAFTPLAAAKIAVRRKIPVVPAFASRRADGHHTIRIDPPLELGDDLKGATAVMTAAIERQIRNAPEQWVWMHRRWRRRPPGEDQPAS